MYRSQISLSSKGHVKLRVDKEKHEAQLKPLKENGDAPQVKVKTVKGDDMFTDTLSFSCCFCRNEMH